MRGSGVGYYIRDLVPGRAEETLVAGESPGRWTGRGSEALGLVGTVDGPAFTEVLAGRDPADGRGLRQSRGDRPVSGFDLAFCAPKSVSVLHLLAPSELGAATGASHQSAVGDALAYVERHGLGVRRVRSGAVQHLTTTGAVAAGFVHRTSRALDPHLHTHVVAANVVQGIDGSWSSLDSRRLFLHRRATEAVYRASLRHHLTEAAGVAWVRGPSGGWEVDGVDPVLCRVFSQRAASIDEHTHRVGAAMTPGARRVAFHADRPDKERGRTVDGLRSSWRRRADDAGFAVSDLVRVVGHARALPGRLSVDPVALESGLEQLVAARTRVSSRDLVAAVADAAPAGLGGAEAERRATALGSGLPVLARHAPGITTDVWEPSVVLQAFRDRPGVVERAPDGQPSARSVAEVETGRTPQLRPDRSAAFGHQSIDVGDLRR